MDSTPQDGIATQPISDDQELAQALAGVLPVEDAPVPEENFAFDNSSTSTVSTPPPLSTVDPNVPAVSLGAVTEAAAPAPASPAVVDAQLPTATTLPSPSASPAPVAPATPTATLPGLEGIKSSALNSLRPLMGKVELPAEEKFDTYLMLIRSTDDASLIEPAHQAAQSIEDEKRKAEALLEIIKEIDYLSRKDQ